MIDTHSHIDGPEFADDLPDVLLRAQAAGIEKIFVPAINATALPHLLELCGQHPGRLYPMVGLHPEEVQPDKIDVAATLDYLEQQLQAAHPLAIGEVGLDFYWDDTYRQEQTDAFERQVEWAERYDLPLMIHARKAHNELISLLRRHHPERLRGVFHCFTGSAEMARQLLQFPNFVLGIGGVLTFKKSKLPQVLADEVPLSRIVLETDAPYMAPVPHRGERNEPAFVAHVAALLADIYATTLSEVDRQTTANVHSVFGTLE